MKSTIQFLLLSIFCVSSLLAQDPFKSMPHTLTEYEKNNPPTFSEDIVSLNSVVPFENPRSMAEWEELQGLVITWDTGYGNGVTNILKEIVRHAKEHTEVIIVCSNEAAVISSLEAANIDTSTGLRFIIGNFNSIWVRDYGPNTVYANDVDTLGIVDWVYNRNRPSDDIVPTMISNEMDIPIVTTTACPDRVVHTGGNYMSDGLGTAFSSELVLEENGPSSPWTDCPLTESEFDEQMEETMGIETYVRMENLPYDVIHHIDMHMKLLDEKTLLVGEYPANTADGPQIEANIQYVLDNFTTTAGEPFEIIRIPMPPEGGSYPPVGDYRTYANAVFVNNAILVPVYQQQYDDPALAIWEEAMPGYEIIGINCNSIIPFLGAIHCITKEVGVHEPLWITTNRVTETCAGETVDISATIKHVTGISTATVHYKTDLAAPYQSVEMSIGIIGDDWFASIPEVAEEGTLYYYIEATASNGKTMTRPMPAPEGYFKVEVKDCTIINNEDVEKTSLALQTIFPNPASAITCIPVVSEQNVDAEIELLDILGRKVFSIFSGTIPSGESKYFINAAEFSAGTYFVQIKTASGIESQKIVIE